MEMTSDKPGGSEKGTKIPIGTKCTYEGHVPGGMVKIKLSSGEIEIVHPAIFPELR